MSIERNIENLTNAFRAFVEVKIEEEVSARMELEKMSRAEYWDIYYQVREKYKKVLEYL